MADDNHTNATGDDQLRHSASVGRDASNKGKPGDNRQSGAAGSGAGGSDMDLNKKTDGPTGSGPAGGGNADGSGNDQNSGEDQAPSG